MAKGFILYILAAYFLALFIVSWFTGRKANNDTFFTGNRNNDWRLVAFGMIGASLSGVTFISIPGTVGISHFTYLQIALGYIAGYAVIAFVLLPLYYKYNLTSIYAYLNKRFGVMTYKMGALFFLVSRLIGSALRMYLVANVLQSFVFESMGVPFFVTVSLSILLIWLYTFRGGIKTIVITDTFQTLFMLISLGVSIYLISDELNVTISTAVEQMKEYNLWGMWQTEDGYAANYWIKGLLGGMFITLGMTGVDQDMMQKNLSCKNLREAQKNMISFSLVLFFVNVLFVFLGAMLFLYVYQNPDFMATWQNHGEDKDLLFATLALEGGLGYWIGGFFVLGLVAAAYSSADSALAALTTSFSVDFLNIEKYDKVQQEKIRKWAHVGMSVALLITILIFKLVHSDSVIGELFNAANYTYGPLLGLFLFGIFSKRTVQDWITIPISILVPVLLFFLSKYSADLFAGYKFGSEMLGINASLVYFLLWISSKKTLSETLS